jgi:hypothetical protein
MKKAFALLLFIYLSLPFAQAQITAADWQSDLRFLQKTVHKDYAFLFKKISEADFDAQVEQLYQDIPKLQTHEIVVGIGRIVSLFQYGHTYSGFEGNFAKFHRLPLNFYQFSDGVYIQAVHRNYPKALGAKVLKIGNMPIEAAMKAIRPAIPVENDLYFKAYGLSYLSIPEVLHAQKVIPTLSQNITLTLEKEGKTFEQTFTATETPQLTTHYGFGQADSLYLDARAANKTPLYLKNLDKIYFFEYLPESKTVYVRHSQIEDEKEEPIPAFYARLFDFIEKNAVERLVLDVRLNGGGNNYKNKPIVTGIIQSSKINQQGKLFVLIGRRTFSACQNLVNELQTYTNAIFVGEPTGENINFYGDNRRMALPKSKIPVALSFAWWQDKPQWENDDYLAPNIAAEMSFDDFRNNRDPILETALNFADKDFVADPMTRLRELFMAQKIDLIQTEAARFAEDPRYRFYNLEGKLNQAAFALIGGSQMQSALFILDLNTKLYPQSAKAWLSLGDGLEIAKQVENAKLSYQKAIDFAANSPIGEQAKLKLIALNEVKK